VKSLGRVVRLWGSPIGGALVNHRIFLPTLYLRHHGCTITESITSSVSLIAED
jgi:hypothetical protein